MKTNFFSCALCCLLLGLGLPVSSQTSYQSLWGKVEAYDKQSLPESAQKQVDVIHQKALKEKNSPQLLKAMIHQLKYQSVKDKDLLPRQLKMIEDYTHTCPDRTEQSMLYGMLAQLYYQYYIQQGTYAINQRTAIVGYIPEDIREWSGNLFVQRITDYVQLSLKHADELQQEDILKYKDILTTGNTSRNLRPTLFDFLSAQGISLLENTKSLAETSYQQTRLADGKYYADAGTFAAMPIVAEEYDLPLQTLKLYQQWLNFRLKDTNPEALIAANLNRLEFVYNNQAYVLNQADYLQALTDLNKQHQHLPFSIEILSKQVALYQPKEAFDACMKGIEKFPDYERINLLRNVIANLCHPSINVQYDKVIHPDRSLDLHVTYKNTQKLIVEIYRIPDLVATDNNRAGLYKGTRGQWIETQEFMLENKAPYLSKDTTLSIPVKQLGYYEFVVYPNTPKNKSINQSFAVSRLYTVSRIVDDKIELLVADRISGKPIENAQAVFYNAKGTQYIETATTNKSVDGLISVPRKKNDLNFYRAYTAQDQATWISLQHYYGSGFIDEDQEETKIQLFTDRSIYRPRQTVFFKGIASTYSSKGARAQSKATYTVRLQNTNGEQVAAQQVQTNEFGSFAGEFALPQGGLNGHHSISIEDYAYQSIQVEEYKRPTFDIRFDTIATTYNLGDKVEIAGNAKTFSGINLQNTEVKYRITRNPHRLWRWFGGKSTQIAEGKVTTDANGKFSLTFAANKDFADNDKKEVCYTFRVNVSVTDSNGETQESDTQVSVGSRSMILSMDDNITQINKDNLPEIKVTAQNLNGKQLQKEGTFQIFSLQAEQSLDKELAAKDWKQGKLMASGTFSTTNQTIDINPLKRVASGRYRIILKATDDQEREVTTEQDFTLYSPKDKTPPITTHIWAPETSLSGVVGKTTEVYFGSSARNVYVLYDIFQQGKKIESNRFMLNNSIQKLSIPFKEEYGAGVSVVFTFIKDNRLFTQTIDIEKKQEDKSLQIKTEVFRDRLLPGQQETWKISVKDANQQPVEAEVLAGMYDASLDKLRMHQWSFRAPASTPGYWSDRTFNEGYNIKNQREFLSSDRRTKQVPPFAFDSFNWFGLNFYSSGIMTMRGQRAAGNSSVMIRGLSVADESVDSSADLKQAMPAAVVGYGTMRAKDLYESSTIGEEPTAAPVRTNFNETAFFYPQLRTNEAGETLFTFTVPESNTSWKWMTVAHTQDMRYGQLVKEVISQKQLMITPNMPRFIRQGDETVITTNISNLSDAMQTGKVTISLLDPATESTVFVVENSEQPFTLASGETQAISWKFPVSFSTDLVICKIVAQSETFSDGEQHLLPVLTNRMLVTESMPISISGKGQWNFSFEKLIKQNSMSAENYRLTVEYAANPVWYAVQALPSMTTPTSDNAVAWFNALYANSLASHIAQSTPKLKQIVEAWAKQGEDQETLISNLEKNEELKAILLEETPWVLDAKTETEQKQRLRLLFDINRNLNLQSVSVRKLKELQMEDGGWSWFKGMQGSTSISQWILYGFSQLDLMHVSQEDESIAEMQQKAVAFIDRMFLKHFNRLKENNRDYKTLKTVSTYELEYLLTRSAYAGIPFADKGKSQEAIAFYQNIVEKHWTQNAHPYPRALSIMLMQRAGKREVVASMIRSLRQHATKDPQQGMYWANIPTDAFFYRSATSIHTFIMQAFHEAGASPEEMNAMKLWLLTQKRTQVWETAPATANAVYVLLKTGGDWLAASHEPAVVQVGGKPIATARHEIGTNYIKQSFRGEEITPAMGEITVTKTDDSPAWGAMYWQYFEDMDKVTASKTGLHVEKKLFIEETSNTSKILVPVSAGKAIKVGDKVVVRLTIRSDREMEYVMLKDLRGACFEPTEQVSGIKWNRSMQYYQTNKDASTNFFFDRLPRGTHVLEYGLFANREGDYSNGTSTVQCLYAPEFVSHTQGERVLVVR